MAEKEGNVLTAKEKALLEALMPQAADEGVEIVTVEIVGSKKAPTIRVFIDAEGGISFDELARTQAWIGTMMARDILFLHTGGTPLFFDALKNAKEG